jgi:molybdate transport system regulatory protein
MSGAATLKRSEKTPLELSGSLWLEKSGRKVFAGERIALLEKIHELGSITKAAKAVGISYKTAWDLVDLMNNLADRPLVERSVGGRGGGGTALTPAGLEVVRQFHVFDEEHRRFLQNIGGRLAGGDQLYALLRRISLKVSARNLFAGTVTKLTRGKVNAMVVLTLKGGAAISATVTRASADALELEVGKEAYAIVKASSVILGADLHALKTSARNLLCGTVTKILDGPVDCEVNVDLGEGNTLCAVITHESASEMGFGVGSHACALFKASSVILGVI